MRFAGPIVWSLLLLAGCASAPPLVTSQSLAARAQASPLVAQRDLAARRVTVRGLVTQSALVARTSVAVTGGPYWATASQVNEQVPVVVLDSGTVLCYFEPEYLSEAADAKEGATVDLDCRVDSFRTDGPRILSVLHDCRRAEPH